MTAPRGLAVLTVSAVIAAAVTVAATTSWPAGALYTVAAYAAYRAGRRGRRQARPGTGDGPA